MRSTGNVLLNWSYIKSINWQTPCMSIQCWFGIEEWIHFVPAFHVSFATMVRIIIKHVSTCVMGPTGCWLMENRVYSLCLILNIPIMYPYRTRVIMKSVVATFCLWTVLPCLQSSSKIRMPRLFDHQKPYPTIRFFIPLPAELIPQMDLNFRLQ